MTARRDEVQTARLARRQGLAQVARLGSRLAATPGWLLVGAPTRFLDPNDRAAAQLGADLRVSVHRAHRGLLALDAELDALDGARPAGIRVFLEWSAWLAGVGDAATLLDQLVPDPRRLFLGATPAMTASTAQRIVDAVAAAGGRVGDGDAFVQAAALSDDDVFDLDATARARLDPPVEGQLVGVLLPLRLETRFVRPQAAGDAWRLRLRVHPDPVALGAPPAAPTREETELVVGCWTRARGDLSTDDGGLAFGDLAAAVGGGRAAWLLRTVEVVPADGGFAASDADHPDQGWRTDGYRVALPEVLQILGDVGGGLEPLGELRPDLAAIAAQADLARSMADVNPDKVPELWWTSYEVALAVGLAVELVLPNGPHLAVLMVTGLGDTQARDVVQAHADRGSLGVVAPMSPTNTVAGAPAADLGRDPGNWLAVARRSGADDGAGLAAALTGDPLVAGVLGADVSLLGAVTPLVTALWPVLWQRWLKDVEGVGTDAYEMGGWAARVLCPLGPYPALRVDDVPYGVLPVVDLAAWVTRPSDPVWEGGIAGLLRGVLPAWAAAATSGGTAAGASADLLLEILGRVPTSRETGSRAFLPLELVALLRATVAGQDPAQVLDQWRTANAAVLDIVPPPARRYQAFGGVQPVPRDDGAVGERLRGYLEESWEQLAHQVEPDGEGSPLVVRLLRHALLLTQAEVSRLGPDPWPTWTPTYLLPLTDAYQLAQDASHGPMVADLPAYAQDRLDEVFPPDRRVVAVVRQFGDVREAVREIAEMDSDVAPGGRFAAAVAAVLDSSSHRLDPWVTALGTRRLRRLNAQGVTRRIGAYGWVDDLHPSEDPTPPTTAGLIHAPGHAQALTAAVLRDHAVHEDDPRWQITASSDLVRLAAHLGDDVRLGIHLSEALGREIERRAGDPAVVLDLRRRFPARPEYAGRRVCDGQQVLDAAPADLPAGLGALDDLRRVIDTYGDLLVADAVHDVVSGRAALAQESMDAAAGLAAPPQLRLLRTRRQGASVRTTVLVALTMPAGADPLSPVAVADPAYAAWLGDELGPAGAWTWTAGAHEVTLADLGLDVADTVLVAPQRLAELAAATLGTRPDGGTAVDRLAALARLGSLVDAQRGVPQALGQVDDGAAQLLERLVTLRNQADAVMAGLTADPPDAGAGARWGLFGDPAQAATLLGERVSAAGSAQADATASAVTLADRIRTLLAPVAGLPLICASRAPALSAAPGLDRDWLEVVAAVRPAMARLEAHQLRAGWPAAASDPARMWSVPEPSESRLVVYGPAAGSPEVVGLALLDDWAETVPSPRHTTYAAFGYDAPRARAPQAVLLAVPPDEAVPLTASALPGMILATRELARARMAQPDVLADWGLAVPTSMVLASGPAATRLVDSP